MAVDHHLDGLGRKTATDHLPVVVESAAVNGLVLNPRRRRCVAAGFGPDQAAQGDFPPAGSGLSTINRDSEWVGRGGGDAASYMPQLRGEVAVIKNRLSSSD